MQPHNTPKPSVRVYYDCRGKREFKPFSDAYKARAFYVSKLKAGKNPEVKKAE